MTCIRSRPSTFDPRGESRLDPFVVAECGQALSHICSRRPIDALPAVQPLPRIALLTRDRIQTMHEQTHARIAAQPSTPKIHFGGAEHPTSSTQPVRDCLL